MQTLLVSCLLRCSSLLFHLNQSSCTRAVGKQMDLWSYALSFCLGKLVPSVICCFWTYYVNERLANSGQKLLWRADSFTEAVQPFAPWSLAREGTYEDVHLQEEVISLMGFGDSWISAGLRECAAQLEATDLQRVNSSSRSFLCLCGMGAMLLHFAAFPFYAWWLKLEHLYLILPRSI